MASLGKKSVINKDLPKYSLTCACLFCSINGPARFFLSSHQADLSLLAGTLAYQWRVLDAVAKTCFVRHPGVKQADTRHMAPEPTPRTTSLPRVHSELKDFMNFSPLGAARQNFLGNSEDISHRSRLSKSRTLQTSIFGHALVRDVSFYLSFPNSINQIHEM